MSDTAPTTGRRARVPALRRPGFRVLLGASGLNAGSMAGELVVVGWLVLEFTDSSFMVGLALALTFLPMVLLGLPAGALADLFDRRRLLRVLDAALALIAALGGVLALFDLLDVWRLFALVFVSGAFRAAYHPIRLAYAHDVAGPGAMISALSLINLSTRCGQLVGAAAAGSLIQRLGPEYAFFGLAALHVGALGMLFALRIRTASRTTPREPVLDNLRAFARELRTNRTLLGLVGLTAAVEVLGFSYMTALPALARDVLGVGAEGLGLLTALQAVGGILATLLLTAQGEFTRRGAVYIGVILLFGLGLIALGATRVLGLAAPVVAFVAGMASLSDILTQAMMQFSVPDHLRGRAMGSWVFAVGSSPLGHLQMGALAAAIGPSAALLLHGAGLVALAGLVMVAAPRLRRL